MIRDMTVTEFAHKIKVNRSTVYRMIKSKSLPEGVIAKVIATHIVITIDDQLWKRK